ncbi:MAG: YHYH protein [Burkholderiaceae bacterium]|nr:YHYH protein [Burkholderiaceae bacterium]
MKSARLALALTAAISLTACSGSVSNGSATSEAKSLTRSVKASSSASAYATVVQQLYVSYFGRPADPAGLTNFEAALQSAGAPTDITALAQAYSSNTAIKSLIDSFGTSTESQNLYGSGTTTAFVTAVFQNVLSRTPATSGLDFWVNAISSGSLSQGDAALAIMSGALTNNTTQGRQDALLINNRLTVAAYFTAQVSAQNATSSYSGAAAATSARTMLSAVTATTNTTTEQTAANATVTSLYTAIDTTKLPVGDTKTTTTTPAVGYLYECTVQSGGGGASSKGPWFNSDGTTWNSLNKISVQGSASWVSSFVTNLANGILSITSNDLPSHNTGTFPIASTDPAYAYDRNPNHIAAQTVNWGLPGNPGVASQPTCVNGGAIGILLTGVKLYNAVDGENRDAGAWEIQDSCQGHPDSSGTYHYHNVSTCVPQKDTAGQHSPLVGYAADGFGIYGNLGQNGAALTNADLDECHGHTHAITVNGVTVNQYHYHATKEFPYTVGCFRGTPAQIR